MVVFRVVKKFRQILSRHQKIRIVELVILMVIGGLLEVGTVSLMLPFVNVAMNSEYITQNELVSYVTRILNIHSSRDLLMIMAILLAAFYILKNLYLLFEINIQFRFVYGNMFQMQKRLLDNFIHRPYEYFLKINSGEIIRIMQIDTVTTFNMLSTILGLFSETVVSAMLIIAVFIMSPIVTIVIASLMIILLAVISTILRPVLKKAGKDSQLAGTGMNKWLLQSIQGIKEIKVLRKERFFQKNYEIWGAKSVNAERKRQVWGTAPRFLIEAASMATVFIAVVILLNGGNTLESLLPVIAAVAMAAIRLLPSVNRISGAVASVSYGEPMLDKLMENLQLLYKQDKSAEDLLSENLDNKDCANDPLSYKRAIEFNNITYRYPESESYVFTDAYMKIEVGDSIGIIGESGAGKTTAVDIILGLLKVESGSILIDGKDISKNLPAWLSHVGYIPQNIFLLDDTIRANVVFGEESMSDDRVWYALKEASLDEFVSSLPDGLDTEIGERGTRLSGGQKQRIGIARALYRNPEVLIFDEATSALDNNTEAAIMESIESLHGRKTLVIIAHRLSTIELCDHIFKVEGGKILKER